MQKEQVYEEIKETLGIVPAMFRTLPESTLELEWNLFKKTQLEESPIPNKYRELMGVAIAAATKCRYCSYYHTEAAKLFGATDEEIEDAAHYAKASAGWSAYINGMQVDFDEFRKEIRQIVKYVESKQAVPA